MESPEEKLQDGSASDLVESGPEGDGELTCRRARCVQGYEVDD